MTMRGQDIGLVGKIEQVNTTLISICKQTALSQWSPISGINGAIYNVMLTAASELAMALEADDLIFVSDVPGVLINVK